MKFAVVGFVVGACVAYSGVGAGALTTPILLFFGIGASTAIGSDLLFGLGTKLMAMLAHLRRRTVDHRVLVRLSLGGIPGALAGDALSVWLRHRVDMQTLNRDLAALVGCALIVSALVILLRRQSSSIRPPDLEAHLPLWPLALAGFFVGTMVSLTSVGSGSLTLPLLLLVVPALNVRAQVGTDVAFAVVLLLPAVLGHYGAGDVNPKLAAWLLLGSVPGTLVGTALGARLSAHYFRMALAVVLLGVGVRLVYAS